jgi:uncharacterized protein (TIGR00369 family)
MRHTAKYRDFADKVRASFGAQTMMRTFDATMTDIRPGKCSISAPILPGARQQQDFGHAALTFALGDSAAGYAALSLMEEHAEVVTVEMKINLLAPASGDTLVATGDVVKAGRRLMIVKAEVHARTGFHSTLVAILQGTMIPV